VLVQRNTIAAKTDILGSTMASTHWVLKNSVQIAGWFFELASTDRPSIALEGLLGALRLLLPGLQRMRHQ